jgi:hypothetical protein
MSNSNELYKRQAIWADYRAGNNSEQAYSNLIKKFGPDSVSKEIITGFYLRFKSGDRSLFDKGAPQHGIPQAIQTLPNGEEVSIFKNSEYKCDMFLEELCRIHFSRVKRS